MAGAGARFRGSIFTEKVPKPLIDVGGKTMIEVVLENIKLNANYYFIVSQSHVRDFNIDDHLRSLVSNCRIIAIDHRTQGPADSALLADIYVDNDDELLITNCDQVFPWEPQMFLAEMRCQDIDGALLTFECEDLHHSYAALDNNGHVFLVGEKERPLDTKRASNGVYYWKKGSYFVESAKSMIRKGRRALNGEFYVGPAYNELILDKGGVVVEYPIKWNKHIGTPKELMEYLNDENST